MQTSKRDSDKERGNEEKRMQEEEKKGARFYKGKHNCRAA